MPKYISTLAFLTVVASAAASAVFVPVANAGLCAAQTDQYCCSGPDSSYCGCTSITNLCLLECPPGFNRPGNSGPCYIPATQTAGMGAFYLYLNQGIWKYAFGIGVAIAVLNGVVAGFQIAASNGDQGKVDAGKTRFMWSVLGLLMLLLAGTLLSFINPAGFQSV